MSKGEGKDLRHTPSTLGGDSEERIWEPREGRKGEGGLPDSQIVPNFQGHEVAAGLPSEGDTLTTRLTPTAFPLFLTLVLFCSVLDKPLFCPVLLLRSGGPHGHQDDTHAHTQTLNPKP